MKGVRFKQEQIIAVLKQHEAGAPTAALCRHGISKGTQFRWKAKYGGMDVNEARRLKAQEDENRRLKQIVAVLTLDNQMLRAVPEKNGDPRNAAGWVAAQYPVSQRRAAGVMLLAWSTSRYRPRPPADEAGLVERLRALAHERRRFGYRRLWALLRREDAAVNRKRIWRLYRRLGLQVARRPKGRSCARPRQPMPAAPHPNARWSMDFVSDERAGGGSRPSTWWTTARASAWRSRWTRTRRARAWCGRWSGSRASAGSRKRW